MVREQTPIAKPISKWTVVALSAAIVPIGLSGAIFTTFSIAGSTVTKTDYASAVIFLFCLGFSCAIAAIGTWGRKVSVVPIISFLLLLFVGLRVSNEIETGSYFSVISGTRSLTYMWLVLGVMMSSPLVILGIRESIRMRSTFRKYLCILLAITVPLVLLLSLAIPIQSEANTQYESYKLEQARSQQLSKLQDAEYEAQLAASEKATAELKRAADKMVVSISDSYDQNGYIPSTYTEPEGYEVTTYTVRNKFKVEFCIKPRNSSSYLGVIVDPSVSDGTMYWYTEPRGGSCEYSYDNFRQL